MNARVRVRHEAPSRPGGHLVPLLLLAALIIGGACWLVQRDGGLKVPPSLTPAAIAALPDRELIYRVTTDLRLALAARGERPDWQAIPAAARNVLALAWVDRETAPGSPMPRFPGFDALVAGVAQGAPAFGDVAASYEAIGAPLCAAVVRVAEETARALPAGRVGVAGAPPPFAELDRRFAAQIASDRTHELLRRHIRSNVEELADAAKR